MNVDTYTRAARSTALPTAYSFEYLAPGLVSEVGELYGVEAKTHRDGLTTADNHAKMVGEWGDVAWVTALLRYHTGTLLAERGTPVHTDPTPEDLGVDLDSYPLPTLMRIALIVDGLAGREERLKDIYWLAMETWYLLERFSGVMTGRSFDQVLQHNLDKLASRKSRGVIGGSGDNR